MKKLIKNIVLFLAATGFVACNKSDDTAQTFTAKPYSEVTPGEIAEIEKFLTDYRLDVKDGEIDFVEAKLNDGLIKNPNLKSKIINYDGYDFKVYYINLNTNRVGELKADEMKSPCPVDSVMVKYRGVLLRKKSDYDTQSPKPSFVDYHTFDKSISLRWFTLDRVVSGWSKIVSQMTPGVKKSVAADNILDYDDFDDVVMFLPSGLGYYAVSQSTIPSYNPLIFHVKLCDVRKRDHEGDKVATRYENFKFDATKTDDPWVNLSLDTDGDKFPDYFDKDDDNDGVLTFDEVVKTKNSDGTYVFWDYANIPTCEDNVKRHLSKKCSK